jgi:hypothetical protein
MAQINKSSEYFNTVLYTGNATGRTISGVGFQPDWTWIKNRSDTSGHRVLDVVRGGTKELIANGTNAEITEAQSLQSWNSDGFVLGTAAGVNANTDNFVSWNWLANGAGVSNTDGSIASTVSANNTAGFSIVKYTGTGSAGNVGHGLSTAPKVLINKALSSQDWFVGHSLIGFTKFLKLNDRIAATTNSGIWNDTAPTTDHFTINSANGNTNSTGVEYITYCFSEIKGFSKFNSYVGNGSTDGVFCYTGMKPAFVILKNISSGSTDWIVYDNKRSSSGGNNVIDAWLAPHSSSAEASNNTANNLDFLSNGFKLRHDNADLNASGSTYIYMAFAENPLVGTNNIPATAR